MGLQSKSKELENEILSKSKVLDEGLKSLKENLSSERERIAFLEKDRESRKKEAERTLRQLESAFQMGLQSKSKELENEILSKSKVLDEELKSLAKEINLRNDRFAALEEDIRNQEKNMENKDKEIADSVEKLQLGEARRQENFVNIVERLKELQIRTETSMKSVSEKINQITKIENSLEKKFHKENEAIFKRLGSSYDELDDRVSESESSLSVLTESIKGLTTRMDEQFDLIKDSGKRLSLIEQDLVEQRKSQEIQIKDLDSVVKTIDEIEEKISSSEKALAITDGLIKRIVLLEEGVKKADVLDKRLVRSESMISQITESLNEIKNFEKTYKKELDSEFRQMIQEKTNQLHKDLVGKSEDIATELKALTKDIYAEREKATLLEHELRTQLGEQKARTKEVENLSDNLSKLDESVSENLKGIENRVSDSEKMLLNMSKAVTDMRTRIMDDEAITKKFEEQSRTIDKVTKSGERITRLEEKTKAISRDNDMRFNELLNLIKELEVAEAKRVEEFGAFFDRFQELRTSTEHNIKIFNDNIRKLSDIKSEIKTDISKENKFKLKEMGIDFKDIKNRVDAAEELLIKMNDMIGQMKSSAEGAPSGSKSIQSGISALKRQLEAEKARITSLDQELKSHEKERRDMFIDINKMIRSVEMAEIKRLKEYGKLIENFENVKTKNDEAIGSVKKDITQLKKMRTEIDSDTSMDEKIKSLTDEMNSRITANEQMYDSEIDGFKNKLDYVVKELVQVKKMQQDLDGMVKATSAQKDSITVAEQPKTITNSKLIVKPIPDKTVTVPEAPEPAAKKIAKFSSMLEDD